MEGSIIISVLQVKKLKLREVKKLTQKTNVCCESQDTGYSGWGVSRRGCKGDFWDAANILFLYLVPGYKGVLTL